MVVFGAFTARRRARAGARRLLAAADRARRRRRRDARSRRRARGLRADAALPGPGRRDGDRQLDDRRGGGAQPARRRDDRPRAARSRRPWRSARPRPRRRRPIVRRSLRSGTIALIDSTKTTGLIFFPGTMVGMLLAGADPTDAVRLQLILLWVLLGSVALVGSDRDDARLSQLLHPGPAAARAAGALALRSFLRSQGRHRRMSADPSVRRCRRAADPRGGGRPRGAGPARLGETPGARPRRAA